MVLGRDLVGGCARLALILGRREHVGRLRRRVDRNAVGRYLRDDDRTGFKGSEGDDRKHEDELEDPAEDDAPARAPHIASPLLNRPATMPTSGFSSSTPRSFAAIR